MTWEAKIEHENCPRDGADRRTGFGSMTEAAHWVAGEIVQHTPPMFSARPPGLSVTIKETCQHDKQALWVKAAREFLAKTGGFYYDDTDAQTNGVYLQTSVMVDKLATCAKCGEAVA